MAGDLGVPGVVLGIGKGNPLFPAPTERLTGYFFEALDVLLPLAGKAGTELWVENMQFSFIGDANTLMAMLDDYGSDEIGFVYDVANAHFIGEDITEGLKTVKDRLKLVHLSDTNQKIYRHDPIGGGDLNFTPIPAALRAAGIHRNRTGRAGSLFPAGTERPRVRPRPSRAWQTVPRRARRAVC